MNNRNGRMPTIFRAAVAGCVVTLSMIRPMAAYAQSSETQAPADGEIIVTAMKRDETVQRIPASISAFSADQLVQRGIIDVRSLALQTPGVNFSDYGGTTFFTIRGLGISVDTGTAEPSVASYVDGVFLPRPTMAKLRLIDLERVEVLRGPQGTLYGRNATAGAVNYISAKPTSDFHAGAEASYGNFNRQELSGFISGGLAEGVMARFSATRERRDGHIRNIFNGDRYGNIDFWSVRGALRLVPSSNFTVDLSAQYQDNYNADAVNHVFIYTTAFPTGTILTTRPWRVASDASSRGHNSTLMLNATTRWDISPDFSLKTITGYVDHKTAVTYDGDATSFPRLIVQNFSRPSKSHSQEINLIGQVGSLKFIVGAYYFHENFFVQTPVVFPVGLGASIPAGATNLRAFRQITDSYAIFTDGTLSLTDSLKLNFGLRYNSDKSDLSQTSGILTAAGTFTGSRDVPGTIKSEKLLPKVGLEFSPNRRLLIYSQFQRGFKAAGPNLGIINKPFDAETIDAYEVGVKSQMLDGRININVAAYYYDYGSLQVTNTPPGAVVSSIVNAQAKIKGAELDMRVKVSPHVDLNLAATVTDAGYKNFFGLDSFQPGLGAQNLSGNELNRTAPFTLNGGVSVRIPLNTGLFDLLSLRGDAAYTDSYYLRIFNLPQDKQRGYADLSGSITLSHGKSYSLTVYGKNLTNRAVKGVIIYAGAGGGFSTGYGPPRMYGATLSWRY